MGGGTDTDEAFLWQIKNANGGDFVILRASGDDAYNPWVYNMSLVSGAKLNSVTTILFNNRDASAEKEVLDLLRNAEAIFMAGGDQSVYVDYWVGTEVQSVIQGKIPEVTIGGTSAGCMVLGNWIYTGEVESITSEEALANPYHRYITIADSFLKIPFLSGLLADTHFG
jgi:cyanophycinase